MTFICWLPEWIKGWMKAKLERQLGILQEKELRALSHTSTSLCPLGQNTLSFQLPASIHSTVGPLHLPGMPFLFHPESSSLSFTFQINYPFSRERCLSVQSQPLSMLLFQLWASFLYHSYKNGALCLCLWLFIYQWFPSVDIKLQRTKSCLFFIHYL